MTFWDITHTAPHGSRLCSICLVLIFFSIAFSQPAYFEASDGVVNALEKEIIVWSLCTCWLYCHEFDLAWQFLYPVFCSCGKYCDHWLVRVFVFGQIKGHFIGFGDFKSWKNMFTVNCSSCSIWIWGSIFMFHQKGFLVYGQAMTGIVYTRRYVRP